MIYEEDVGLVVPCHDIHIVPDVGIDIREVPPHKTPVDRVTVVGIVLVIPELLAPLRQTLEVLLARPRQPLRIPPMVWRRRCEHGGQPMLASDRQSLVDIACSYKSGQRCDFPRLKKHLYPGEANLIPSRTCFVIHFVKRPPCRVRPRSVVARGHQPFSAAGKVTEDRLAHWRLSLRPLHIADGEFQLLSIQHLLAVHQFRDKKIGVSLILNIP